MAMRRFEGQWHGNSGKRRIPYSPTLAAAIAAAWICAVPAGWSREMTVRPGIDPIPNGATATIWASPAGQTDSFYLQRFREGVKSYQEARYDEASRALEIAMFGLAGDKSKLTECLIYAGLSAHHQKNDVKAKEFILRAGSLLDTSGIEKPALKEPDNGLLDKLLVAYKAKAEGSPMPGTTSPAWTTPISKTPEIATPATKAPAAKLPSAKTPVPKAPEEKSEPAKNPSAKTPVAKKAPAAAPPAQKAPAETNRPRPAIAPPPPVAVTKSESSPIADLEKRLLAEPDNAPLIHELADAYLEKGNPAKARQLLEPYLRRQPEDYAATFLLAKADYRLRRFRPAITGFHALSSPQAQRTLAPETSLKTGLYRALCLFRLGDHTSLPSVFASASSGAPPTAIEQAISAEGLTADWAALRKALGR